jgi:hypothetical protein
MYTGAVQGVRRWQTSRHSLMIAIENMLILEVGDTGLLSAPLAADVSGGALYACYAWLIQVVDLGKKMPTRYSEVGDAQGRKSYIFSVCCILL